MFSQCSCHSLFSTLPTIFYMLTELVMEETMQIERPVAPSGEVAAQFQC